MEEDVKILEIDTSKAQANVDKLSSKVSDLSKNVDKIGKDTKTGFDTAGTALKTFNSNTQTVNGSMQAMSKILSGTGSSLNGLTSMMSNFSSVLPGLSGGLSGVIKGIGAMTKSALTFIATPVGAVIAAIVLALKGLSAIFGKTTEAIKKNDDASTAFAKLYSVTIQPILTATTKMFDKLATGIGWVANKLADLIGANGEYAKSAEDLVVSTDKLQDKEREYAVESAKRQNEISDLRAKAADKEKYTAAERQKMLEDAIELEKQDALDRKTIAEEKLRLLKLEAEQNADTSDEMKNKIAEANAAVIQSDTDYNNTVRRLSKELTTAKKEDAAEQKAIADAAAAAEKERTEAEKASAKQEIEDANTALDIRIEQNNRKEQSERKRLEEELKIENERLKLLDKDSLAYEKQQTKIGNLEKAITKLDDAEKKELETKKAQAQSFLSGLEEKTELNKIADEEDQKLALLKSYKKENLISEKEFEAAKTKITEDAKNKRDKLREEEAAEEKAKLQMQVDAAIQTSLSFLDTAKNIASLFADESKEAFEAQKAFEIGTAVINTITGAVGAYSGAAGNQGLNDIPVVGPILAQTMGIANAAAVVAGGATQVKEIASRKFGDKNTNIKGLKSSSATPSTSATSATIMPPTQFSQAVQGAELESKIGDTRVYVTEGDISKTQNRVSVQESENRY